MRSVAVGCGAFVLVVACGSSDDGGAGGTSSSSSSSGGSSGSLFSTEQRSGVATYYDADGSGNCSFDPSPDDLDVAAFDTADYDGSNACGSCVRVAGPKGEVTVRIVDSCPGCEKDHLDLSKQAFAKIAELSAGRVPITLQTVACNVQGNLSYVFKDGSSIYWTAIQVRNHRLPIAKLEVQKNGAFVALKREDYNYFVDASGVGKQPNGLVVRVTAADGQTITDTLPGDATPQTVQGGSQFK